jgi:thiol-disulfide isomerase/thioredoxin
MRITALLFLFCIIGSAAAAQQRRMATTLRQGYGPFMPGNVIIFPAEQAPLPTAVPPDITEYRVRQVDFQPYNTWYRQLAANGMSREDFLQQMKDVPAGLLTAQPYHHVLDVLVGYNKAGKKVVIPDVNGNLSFIDDDAYEFEQFVVLSREVEAKKRLPVFKTQYTFFNGEGLVSRELHVKADPYLGMLHMSYTDTSENRFFMEVSLPEHRRGVLKVGNREYEALLANGFTGLNYTEGNAQLLLFADSSAYGSTIPYNVGDVLNIGGSNYLFESVSAFGDTVTFRYTGKAAGNEGIMKGHTAPAVTALQLNGAPFSLADYRGRYLLLDFWGTWCGPCIAGLPELRALQQKFRQKNFSLVSIANDQEREQVRKVVQREQMGWTQVFQNDIVKGKESALIRKLKISSYPAFILIDPEGVIIARDEPLRVIGELLEKALP